MSIVQRIISIAIFAFFTLVSAYKISITKNDYRKIKIILIKYILFLCVISALYIPAQTADLTRLRIFVEQTYSNMSFGKYLETLRNTSTFTTHTFYYIIAKLGLIQVMSIVPCFINYSIFSYIIYDYSKSKKINSSSVAKVFIFYLFMGQIVEVISGMRSMCSFSILFFCLYREFFKSKGIMSNLLFYLLAIGFHNAVVPLVIIRFMYLLIQKENKILKRCANYLIFILLLVFSLKYGSTILEATNTKAQTYLGSNIYSYFWTFLSTILTIILIVYMYISNKEKIREKIPRNYRILFLIYITIDSLFCFKEYSIFRRYCRVVVMLFLPILLEIFDSNSENLKKGIILKQNTIYYALNFLIFLIEASRGDLCGLRFL